MLWGHRYGFVRAAMRSHAPLVPLACAGGDEMFDLVGDAFARGRRWQLPIPLPRPAHVLAPLHLAHLRFVIGEPIPTDGDPDDDVKVRRLPVLTRPLRRRANGAYDGGGTNAAAAIVVTAHPSSSLEAPGRKAEPADGGEVVMRAAIPLDILVVEDDPSTRSVLETAIRELGHSCRAASDGDEAWRMLEAAHADVVISDWELPGLNGAELCRRIRSIENGAYTYFILMTGFHDRAHLLEGMAAGADDYQKKPVDLDELEARLVSAARVVALHRRLAEREHELRRDSSQLWAASRTDRLTGVGNRLRMEEELAAAYSRARRYGHRYSLAIVDVDHFKEFNDGFGHLAGDAALKQVAGALRDAIRSGDAIFRYGGEEFVVLLPEQPLADAQSAVERMRADVEAYAIRRPEKGRTLTVSAGVAELDPHVDAGVEEWIARADAALYFAKGSGRNRVESLPAERGPQHA